MDDRRHDLRVTFLEPYQSHRALSYASDIEYPIRRYGVAGAGMRCCC